jgi:hypothetical protein
MANNVYTIVSIEATPKVIKEFTDKIITSEVKKLNWSNQGDLIATNLYNLIYDNYPKEYSRDWNCENIGAKWCFVHDWQVGDDNIEITFDSAWSPPDSLFHQLAEYFMEFGDFEMEATSEDEAYQNISGGYANETGSEFLIQDTDIPEWPDPDDFDSNETHDAAMETFYCTIDDLKENLIHESKQDLILYP